MWILHYNQYIIFNLPSSPFFPHAALDYSTCNVFLLTLLFSFVLTLILSTLVRGSHLLPIAALHFCSRLLPLSTIVVRSLILPFTTLCVALVFSLSLVVAFVLPEVALTVVVLTLVFLQP